jgi:phosphatidylglycerophosphatase C
VALFDLDGTLTWHDTLLPFLGGFLVRHPSRWWRLWQLPGALFGYLIDKDRGMLKSRAITLVMGGVKREKIDAWADEFVATLQSKGRLRRVALGVVEVHRQSGDRLVLLSASPDLYVPKIGAALGFERTLCTEVSFKDDQLEGFLMTPNRRGEEKTRCLDWLRRQYADMPVIAYGNSDSDVDHLRKADRALLVNGNTAARQAAAAAQIPTAVWS